MSTDDELISTLVIVNRVRALARSLIDVDAKTAALIYQALGEAA